jgi:hypothetical protein
MDKGNPDIERSAKILIYTSGKFTSGKSEFGVAVFFCITIFFCIVIFAIAFITDSLNSWTMPANAGPIIGLLFLAYIIGLSVSRQWTAEINLAARRFKIFRRSFGRWTKTVVDCPLDECNALGTIEYNTEGHISYGVYVELRHGTRHAIPLKESTFKEAARVASELSTATGIPRLDTIF